VALNKQFHALVFGAIRLDEKNDRLHSSEILQVATEARAVAYSLRSPSKYPVGSAEWIGDQLVI
jgi:hypothetical protein